ncbi:EamA family transporter [archaeon]|nr:EamA family transporter [archaeon]
MQYLWLALALFYAIMHATVSVIDKKIISTKNIDPLALSAIRFGVNSITSAIILLLFITPTYNGLNTNILLLSTFYFLAAITYFYAIKIEDVSKIIPYRDAIVTKLSFILAIIILKETTTLTNIFGILAIVFGGYIVWTDGKIIKPKFTKGLVLIGISAVCLALYGIIAKISLITISPYLLSFFMYTLITAYMITTNLIFNKKKLNETRKIITTNKKLILLILLASITAVTGVTALFFALSIENASKVLPIAGTLPLFAAIMGKKFLNESHGKERIIGAAIIITGIFLLYI